MTQLGISIAVQLVNLSSEEREQEAGVCRSRQVQRWARDRLSRMEKKLIETLFIIPHCHHQHGHGQEGQ